MVKFNCNFCGKQCLEINAHYNKTKKHYCSYRCYWKDKKGEWIDKICKQCGKKYSVAVYKLRQSPCLYCGNDCWRRWQKEHKIPRKEVLKRYNNKIKTKLYKRNWREEKLYEGNLHITDESKCYVCGTRKLLVIHHIDGNNGNMGNILNNSKDNLRILCRSCHPKIHSHGQIRSEVVSS